MTATLRRNNNKRDQNRKKNLSNGTPGVDDVMCIRVENLSKTFRVRAQDIPVLKNINLVLDKGEFTIIFGPSGCGKSTLLNTILGLEPPTSGAIHFYGKNLYKLSVDEITEERKMHIGTVFQQPNWVKSLSVIENVAFPLSLRGIDRTTALPKASEKLQLVGLKRWEHYDPTELSVGQQQKASLARCLVTDPDLIIADEPTGNLDYRSGKTLMEMFTSLNKEGKTVIMVTHDLEYLTYAENIVQIFDGEVIKKVETKGKTREELQEILIPPSEEELLKKLKYSDLKPDIQPEPAGRKSLGSRIKRTPALIRNLLRRILTVVNIHVLLLFYSVNALLIPLTAKFYTIFTKFFHSGGFGMNLGMKTWQRVYLSVCKLGSSPNSIRLIDLIDLSLQHMGSKKSRSLVTIGGVGIGIGFIIFLLSIGYGLEHLVISRVASLKERTQLDVIPAVSANVLIDDETLELFEETEYVEKALPIINVAAKLKFEKSNLDIVTYGAQAYYLENTDADLVEGEIYPNNELNALPAAKITSDEEYTEKSYSENNEIKGKETDTIVIPKNGTRKAIANTYLLDTLGLSAEDAIGKEFELSFVVSGNQLDREKSASSNYVTYEIIGVIEEEDTPLIYVPISEIQELGVSTYSQVKLVLSDESSTNTVRSKIKAQGFSTYTVHDTIEQIENIFRLFRMGLAIIGFIALAVAALGMFNTLTVSLLERTREIGLMKAIGMKSSEIFELMITEATTMGIIGGLTGIGIGFLAGKLLSVIASIISVVRGDAPIDLTVIPLVLIILTALMSSLIGTLTGIFPARRSTRISALDALRYE